jgi:ribokinase
MCQLENPLDAVLRAAQVAAGAGVPVLLNPAPAQPLPAELLRLVTLLAPNETEAWMLSGQGVSDDQSAVKAASVLRENGVGSVVITLGARGALVADAGGYLRAGGYPVDVVDTTAAGDAFCAGLAVQYALGQPLEKAAQYANAVGALACTVMGSTPAMPRREVVEQCIAARPAPDCYRVSA